MSHVDIGLSIVTVLLIVGVLAQRDVLSGIRRELSHLRERNMPMGWIDLHDRHELHKQLAAVFAAYADYTEARARLAKFHEQRSANIPTDPLAAEITLAGKHFNYFEVTENNAEKLKEEVQARFDALQEALSYVTLFVQYEDQADRDWRDRRRNAEQLGKPDEAVGRMSAAGAP
jgi:hypothetical protein